jgi:hypothetical protein
MRALLFAAILATGCVRTAGREFPTEAQVREKIRIGMTDADVVASFGAPVVRQPEGAGTEALLYIAPPTLRTADAEGYTGFEVRLRDGRVAEWVTVTGRPAFVRK